MSVLPTLVVTLTTGRSSPQPPTWTRGAHPAEAREETDEAAESLPSGTTGSCTGSGIRGGLLGGRVSSVGGKEGFGEQGSGAGRRKFGFSAWRVGEESCRSARPHPRVAEAGAAGALMLLRERVPVRDSCVVRSCGGAGGGADVYGPPSPAWSQKGNEGEAAANWQGECGHSKFPLPLPSPLSHPTPQPPPLAAAWAPGLSGRPAAGPTETWSRHGLKATSSAQPSIRPSRPKHLSGQLGGL